MASSDYLFDFLYNVDVVISEINKLNSRTRQYQNNSKIFGIDYAVKFSASPDYFIKLRNFLEMAIDNHAGYNKKIANLKRDFSKNYLYIVNSIQREIARIDYIQETHMNKIVYKAVYDAKISNENKKQDFYDVKSSFFDRILGIKKYRKLASKNHELRAKFFENEYIQNKRERKTIFELVCMIGNSDVKTGELLCLKDNIIKAFMIDRNTVEKECRDSWKPAILIPHGFNAKREYYRILNKKLTEENEILENKLNNRKEFELEEECFKMKDLIRLNSKLTKIARIKVTEI